MRHAGQLHHVDADGALDHAVGAEHGLIAFQAQPFGDAPGGVEAVSGRRQQSLYRQCGVICCAGLHGGIEGSDHLQAESRADPHGVGVDQLLADVGSGSSPSLDHFQSRNSGFAYFLNKFLRLLVFHPARRTMSILATGSPVEVVQTEPAILVLVNLGTCNHQRAHALALQAAY
ncbi:hypothetical protein FQZ97_898030 [compost metagenome]